jgi:hypothetical protein
MMGGQQQTDAPVSNLQAEASTVAAAASSIIRGSARCLASQSEMFRSTTDSSDACKTICSTPADKHAPNPQMQSRTLMQRCTCNGPGCNTGIFLAAAHSLPQNQRSDQCRSCSCCWFFARTFTTASGQRQQTYKQQSTIEVP